MLGIRILIYIFIFALCSLIGILISQKYVNRVKELKEFKNALNIFKTKIKYTYETLPDIFNEISRNTSNNISNVFRVASENMKNSSAGEAWEAAIKLDNLNINNEDRDALSNLSKLLGKTDLSGQISQIELTSNFLEGQIKKAEAEQQKNEKLYKTLGMIIGVAIVIVVI